MIRFDYNIDRSYFLVQFAAKGQIKPKAVWVRRRFSQKTDERICFVCREKQTIAKKQTNSLVCFLGESTLC